MNDRETRELAHRFFDALETNDFETIRDIYHDDLKFWINSTDRTISKEENLAILEKGQWLNRRRTYDDRRINTFQSGFVCQYSCNIVRLDGSKFSAWACLIARCREGKITHMEEYLDTSKSRRPQAA